jgi:Uma2 family endonuclease
MSVLTAHRFTVEDYHRMADTGVLKPDARVELLNGQIIDMAPIGPFHGGLTNRLNRLFTGFSRNRFLVSAQNPVRLDEHSEPQPDLMLLKPAADDYTSRLPGPQDVFLLIEVADSTLAFDRREKLPAYGRAGIGEVWIINLPEQCVEIYREPHFTGYGVNTIHKQNATVSPQAFPDATVEVSVLLKRSV